ncbi:MAG: alpha/beta fold hydrolase [Terracidiphilus sp.]
MKKKLFIASVLLVLGAFAYLLTGRFSASKLLPDRPQLAPGVAMQDLTFFSTALQRQMPYRVFLPEKLAPGRKLPVVYLLHGGNGGFRDWSNRSDVARYAAQGLILVMPEGAFSYYQNAALKPEDKYEDYLTNDLIADVERRFPAATGRENRAIIGISMGGFAVARLALSRPDLLAFAGALSPSIDVCQRRFHLMQWWRLTNIFGPVGSKTRTASDPFVLARSADPAHTPYIYLTAGEMEPLLLPNRRFAALLQSRGFAYEFHTKPGGHDWGEWDAQIPGCFESLMQRVHVR